MKSEDIEHKVQAVDLECYQALQSDNCCLHQCQCHFADTEQPFNKFHRTDINIQNALKQEQNYLESLHGILPC